MTGFHQLQSKAAPAEPIKLDGGTFDSECLAEYAEVFKTVSVDATYYTFPRRNDLQKWVDQVPDDFRFGFKVTDAITLKRFPNVRKSGAKAGLPNPNFLNAEMFAESFLRPCEQIRANVGVLMLEFSRFWPSDYKAVSDFVCDLDSFLGRLPKGWPYSIEMRNKEWLVPDYLTCLSRYGVTHVFNSWDAMPSVSEQMAIPNSLTNPALTAARFLLKPGRKYEEAVKTFAPYDRVQEKNDQARAAGAKLIADGQVAAGKQKTFIYVNNRLEGNALETIDAMLQRVTFLKSAGDSSH